MEKKDKRTVLEEQLIAEIRSRMQSQNVTLEQLGGKVSPEAKRPAQNVLQYLNGQRGLITGQVDRMLQELGATRITIEWE